MSAMSSVEWRILPFSNRNFGPPKLLFKFITHSDGFDLYVTDIVHCWKESRDRASIAKEAAKSRSSIDPNEDPGQLDVLLSKLRDGLMGLRGGRCKIGSLHHNKQENRSFWGFRILTRTPLPAPLQPLLWTFQLVQERHILLTRELLLPALSSELKYRMQVEELRRKIEEKDHVITRLMDKIEQSSMDLSLVFPGYSTGRKGLKAQQAVKIVPGLSKFDGVGWQKAHADDQLATTRSLVETISKPGAHQLSFEAPHNPYDGDAGWEPFGAAGEWREDWIEGEYHDPTFTDLEESTDGKLPGAHSVPKLPVEESSSAFEVFISSCAQYCYTDLGATECVTNRRH
jgi:XLF-Cernunnos, XRcc4-like factor, NHEJ component